ncbi:radical SAM family heme chaperone HemW [Simplicispira hankyongi]|uniref:Heme chaperone HemW n=1 Tax=Simplicispira hankyongi TaxID=2315688 RepID=A0A398CFN3_9BURK|nr:radical SAM family heme chaperone HemW [Simplicispira hankyongi]RID99848.1 oxygen-independent coproporphyrinogen III oxidase-like protein [Simplicispira hankyongi]
MTIPILPANEAAPALQRDIQHYMRPGLLQLSALPPLSLYVHLPWCLKKCPYCDFNSHAVGGAGALPEARYLDALHADLEAALPLIWGRPVQTVFIGGGTPSLFSPASIDQLLGDIRALLPLAAGAEITLEANPGTFEKDRFRAYRSAGVTRLSVGVQSFNDTYLAALGRVHDGAQARAAVEEAAQAFDTFNLDLMYALPGQGIAALDADLDIALALAPPHLSIYHLTIEPNTFFAKYPPAIPEDDLAYAMLDRITERTAAVGLQRYEVSAYAQPGHGCAHNLNYWQFGDYLGIGAGAHSKISFAHRVVRQTRFRDPVLYMDHALAGHAMARDDEVRRADLAFEFMLNALRLRGGFALQDFVERTGQSVASIVPALDKAEAQGLIARDMAHVRPTERGFDFLSNLQELFLPG